MDALFLDRLYTKSVLTESDLTESDLTESDLTESVLSEKVSHWELAPVGLGFLPDIFLWIQGGSTTCVLNDYPEFRIVL